MIPKGRKKKLRPVPIMAVAALAAVCAVLLYHGLRNRQAVPIKENGFGDGSDEYEEDSGTVLWGGKEYRYNDHLSNFLFLGIDKREPEETEVGHADAGQSDALFLVSWDRVEQSLTVISIPRDTMTDMEVFSYTGESLGRTRGQICLAYAYGDGSYRSLELAEDAVSNLFYGLPIQGVCSINLDALPILAESVGGVEVTVPNDSLEGAYPEFKEGVRVTLDAGNTEVFVRYRNVDVSRSAAARLERQDAFLRAFGEKAQSEYGGDTEFVAGLYTDLEPYMVSTIGKDQFAKLMESMDGGNPAAVWTVSGEWTEGETYEEYHADDDALYEQIIHTFYVEAGG